VIVSPHHERVTAPYLDLLEREADLYADLIDRERPVIQFHWGGGTPTYLNPEEIRRAHAIVAERFRLAPEAEQSIEIHVTWTTDEQLRTLAGLGFNRLSLGVQDFNEQTQAAIRRRQTFERTREMVRLARSLGMRGINFDLIYGLPHQTAATFGETVDRVLELRPDRLAVYNFAFLPGRMHHQRAIDPATLPRGEEKIKILLEAHDRFVAAGYRYIGMDHFALPEDELARAFDEGTMQRNFMGFTTRAGADLLGLGVSAISAPTSLYAQNVKRLTEYRAMLEAGRLPVERGLSLGTDDLIRRDVISGLMCRDHVDKREIEEKYGIAFDEYFESELARLEPMIADELLEVREDALVLSFLGRLFVRNIAMVFDAYLNRPKEGKEKVVYSRTL
jgi:oxygen-independent coproporphyrinogen-3 oxidase